MQLDGRRLAIRVFIFCLIAEILFVFLDATVNYDRWIDVGPIRRLFNTAREDGLASWFMIMQTMVASLVLFMIATVEKDKGTEKAKVIGWVLLGLFFFYLSADDGAKIHERLGSTFNRIAEDNASLGEIAEFFPSYGWQIAVLPFLASAGILMVFFLWFQMPTIGARVGLFGAAGLMALAVGMDFIEGLDEDHPWNLHIHIADRWDFWEDDVRHFAKSIEEFLEMVAISLLLMLFIQRLAQAMSPEWTIVIVDKNSK